jgi:hypothetical protein
MLVAQEGAAQQRDRPASSRTGRLTGRVVAADTGPVPRVRILVISATDRNDTSFAITDDAGMFAIDEISEGRYSILASRPGLYLDTVYGQGDVPKLVSISSGRDTSVEIRMQMPGVVAGRVFDEAGDPLPLAQVILSRSSPQPAPLLTTAFAPIGGGFRASTNDRGEYRLFGLPPGEYLLYATAPRILKDPNRYAPVYFPGVIDVGAATRLQIASGQEIANADFVLRRMRTISVSGIAVGPDDQPVTGGSIALYVGDMQVAGLNQVGSIKQDGTFSFDALPGQYTLRVRYAQPFQSTGTAPGRNFSAATPISIGTEDISGLLLKLSSGATLRGRATFEGITKPDPAAFKVIVPSGSAGAVVDTKISPDGSFTLENIESGPSQISTAAPAGWSLKTIFMHGRDVSDVPFEFTNDAIVSDVSIVFTDAAPRLTLAVDYSGTDAEAVIIVFPKNRAWWRGRRTRIVAASTDPVVLEGLPAGDYLAVALDDVPAASIRAADEATFDRLRPVASGFQLTEQTPASLRLRAMPFPR